MSKRLAMIWIIGLSVLLAGCSAEPTSSRDGLPNVIFILVDDLGWSDVGYNGSAIATPNLNQMASEGLVLERNYVYPVCSPTRAALLSGQYPFKYGIDGPMSDDAGMPLEIRTMPEYFRSLGYETHMIGKWHLGIAAPEYFPIRRGFDSHYGFLGGWIDYYTHVYNFGLDWQRDGVSVREEGHATELLTAEALRLIAAKSQADRPFFLYLSYNAPHTPYQPVPVPSGLNESLGDGTHYIYGEMVTGIDTGIGRLFRALDAADLSENTLVIFSSDNGGANSFSNGELRGSKGSIFDGAIRVPGIVWWKGRIKGGRTLNQPIMVYDWLPTLLDAMGEESSMIDNLDGQSMWPAIADGAEVDQQINIFVSGANTAVLDWPWKYVDNTMRGPNGVRTVELFDINNDPGESVDLAKEMPDKFAELSGLIAALPEVASLRDTEPPPERRFVDEDGNWNFGFKAEETREPWTDESAQPK